MFFLKELPSEAMVSSYVDTIEGVQPEQVSHALLMMRQASVLVRRLERYFANYQLSQLRFLVLMVIDRELERDSLTAVEITERLDVSKPVMTRTLQRLMQDGLIQSELDESDARAKQIRLTAQGTETLAAMLPGYFREIASYMSSLETL